MTSRAILAMLLGCCLWSCGGGDAGPPTREALAAARALSGNAEVSGVDASIFTRRRALAAQTSAVAPNDTEALFALAESSYRQYFPSHQSNQTFGGYLYRYYPETGIYLGIDDDARVYVLGGVFGPDVLFVGTISKFVKECRYIETGFEVPKLDSAPDTSPAGDGGTGSGPGGTGVGTSDGAVVNADVSIYNASDKLLGTAVSDEKGLVRVRDCGFKGPFKIVYAGNSRAQYFDEGIALRGALEGGNPWRPFQAGDMLSVVVENLTDHHIGVSVMTHIAALSLRPDESTGGSSARKFTAQHSGLANSVPRRSAAKPSSSDGDGTGVGVSEGETTALTVAQVNAANRRVKEIFNKHFASSGLQIDDITRIPSLAFSLESLRSFGNDSRGRYAQMTTALSKSAAQFNPTLVNPAREMTKQLTLDLSRDDVLDGKVMAVDPVSPNTGTRAYDASQISASVASQALSRLTTTNTGQGAIIVSASTAGALQCIDGSLACYPFGTIVTLQAVPGPGSNFLGWVGPCAAATSASACQVTMAGDKLVTANFGVLPQVLLTVARAGDGSGSVTGSPGDINCGNDCMRRYAPGTLVTLNANAASGSMFAGWSGACNGTGTCIVTMDESESVTATFTLIPKNFTLTIVLTGAGAPSGTVFYSLGGLLQASAPCTGTCTITRNSGEVVTLSAEGRAYQSIFRFWGGACAGSGTCSVTMDADKTVTATFDGL